MLEKVESVECVVIKVILNNEAFFISEKTYEARSSKFGSQSSEFWLMYTLDDGQPHSQKQICDEWGFPKTTINSTIKKCETEEYLTLLPIPGKEGKCRFVLQKIAEFNSGLEADDKQ